jgi:hypothetical protein
MNAKASAHVGSRSAEQVRKEVCIYMHMNIKCIYIHINSFRMNAKASAHVGSRSGEQVRKEARRHQQYMSCYYKMAEQVIFACVPAYVRMHACMHVCMCACMYICMCIFK